MLNLANMASLSISVSLSLSLSFSSQTSPPPHAHCCVLSTEITQALIVFTRTSVSTITRAAFFTVFVRTRPMATHGERARSESETSRATATCRGECRASCRWDCAAGRREVAFKGRNGAVDAASFSPVGAPQMSRSWGAPISGPHW